MGEVVDTYLRKMNISDTMVPKNTREICANCILRSDYGDGKGKCTKLDIVVRSTFACIAYTNDKP